MQNSFYTLHVDVPQANSSARYSLPMQALCLVQNIRSKSHMLLAIAIAADVYVTNRSIKPNDTKGEIQGSRARARDRV